MLLFSKTTSKEQKLLNSKKFIYIKAYHYIYCVFLPEKNNYVNLKCFQHKSQYTGVMFRIAFFPAGYL